MKISIIIPALNEEKCLKKCLSSIFDQDFTPEFFEVLFVDNGSTDRTMEIAQKFNLIIYSLPEASISKLRNFGAEKAKGNILAFVDADMMFPRNWLRCIHFYFEKKNLEIFGFTSFVPEDASWIGKLWNYSARADKMHIREVDFLAGRNIYLPKSLFEEISGFDENLATGEDKDFCFRLRRNGYKVISVPGKNIIHLGYENNFREFFYKEFWRQSSLLALAKKWGYSPRTLRMPLVCLYHLILSLYLVVIVLNIFFKGSTGYLFIGFVFFMLLLPAIFMSLLKTVSSNDFRYFGGGFFVYFTRYFIGGISLIWHLALNFPGGAPEGGPGPPPEVDCAVASKPIK